MVLVVWCGTVRGTEGVRAAIRVPREMPVATGFDVTDWTGRVYLSLEIRAPLTEPGDASQLTGGGDPGSERRVTDWTRPADRTCRICIVPLSRRRYAAITMSEDGNRTILATPP